MGETALAGRGLVCTLGDRVLLDGVDLTVEVGEKIGLIGDNGSGKSTLLALLARRDVPESGVVEMRRDARLAVLDQEPRFPADATGRALLEDALSPLLTAISAYEEAASRVDPEADALLARVEELGGWEWERHLQRIAHECGLSDLDAAVGTMSGGEQKRLAVARLRLTGANVVLLDEPTNHLDAPSVERLERWLVDAAITAVFVTHDRYFLEVVADRIVELRGGQLREYAGGYSDYLVARAREEATDARVRHRRLQLLKGELEWARRSPKARTTKSRARLDRIDVAQQGLQASETPTGVADVRFGGGPRVGKRILELHDVAHGFAEDAPPLVEALTWRLAPGERWGILGPNGCGKTTLLRLVLGQIEPDEGRVVLGVNTRMAYFDQQRAGLDEAATLRDTVAEDGGDWVFPGGRQVHVAGWLRRFAFPPHVHGMRVEKLSGGERARLALARFLLADANLLLMDEPTNDLDLLTLSVLEEALLEFPGCVLVVSHDRYFLDRVVHGVLAFERDEQGRTRLDATRGGYSARLAQRAGEQESARQSRPQPSRARPPEKPAKGGLSYLEKKELEGIEAAIEAADARVGELEEAVGAPEVWTDGGAQGIALQGSLEEARAEANKLYTRWEDLLNRQSWKTT